MKSVVLFVTTLLLLGGCASLPEALRTAPEQKLLPFAATATTNPEGQEVRWAVRWFRSVTGRRAV